MDEKYAIGIDGYPLDPDHPWNRPNSETLEQSRKRIFWRRMLDHERAWMAGNTSAIAEAVATCWRFREPPPAWLWEAIDQFVDRRTPNAEKRRRREMDIHMMRWIAVTELRERRFELPFGDDRGMTWEKCYAAVAEMLADTEAAGSEETIRASYKLIQQRNRFNNK
jgi:hypothetical protein